MTTKFASTILLSLSLASAATSQTLHSNAHIGIIYPLSTNGAQAADYTNNFSLHLISGVSRNETSVCVSGLVSIVKDSATGVVASGWGNVIGNSATGVQAAGIFNYTRNKTTGIQAAGMVNISGPVEGAQCAGIVNVARGNVNGIQLAGYVNKAKNVTFQGSGFANVSDTNRSQLAGYVNVAKSVTGIQGAGFVNVSREVNGAQAAGFVNVAKDVKGIQAAGFINVARKVDGVQVAGFINVADSCDYPIGLINIIRKGEKSLGAMMDETGTTYATFRSGGKVLYGIVGAGYNGSKNRDIYAAQVGLGAHISISRAFRISGEATMTTLFDIHGNTDFQSGLRLLPSVRIWNIEIYGGPSFSYAHSSWPGAPFDHHSVWQDKGHFYTHELYAGFVGGIQFHF